MPVSALEQFKQGVRGKLHILAFERKQKAEAAAKATRLSRRNSGTNILAKLRGYKSQPAGRAKAQARLCRGSQKGTRSSPEGSGARAQGSSPQTGLPFSAHSRTGELRVYRRLCNFRHDAKEREYTARKKFRAEAKQLGGEVRSSFQANISETIGIVVSACEKPHLFRQRQLWRSANGNTRLRSAKPTSAQRRRWQRRKPRN